MVGVVARLVHGTEKQMDIAKEARTNGWKIWMNDSGKCVLTNAQPHGYYKIGIGKKGAFKA